MDPRTSESRLALPGDDAHDARPTPGEVPRWLGRGASWAWRLLLIAGAIWALLFVISKLLVVVVPVVFALFGTAILGPPARWLHRRGLPLLLATWLVLLAAIGLVALFVWWLVPSVTSEFADLQRAVSNGLGQVRSWLIRGPLHISGDQIDAAVRRIQAQASEGAPVLVRGALTGAQLVLEGIAAALLSLVLTFFFVKDGTALARWVGTFAMPERRQRLEGAAAVGWSTFSAYVQGTAINGLINGTVMGIGLAIIGVPLALPIAVLTFFGGFFPLVGALIAGAVAVLVALATKGASGALLVLALAVLIHHLEGYIVGPLVLGRKVKLHAVVILLALSIGTVVGGIFGAFVAVPIVAICLALIEYYRGLSIEVVANTGHRLPGAPTPLAIIRHVPSRRAPEGGTPGG
jgi:predicted PurR-regulated permease PerM